MYQADFPEGDTRSGLGASETVKGRSCLKLVNAQSMFKIMIFSINHVGDSRGEWEL